MMFGVNNFFLQNLLQTHGDGDALLQGIKVCLLFELFPELTTACLEVLYITSPVRFHVILEIEGVSWWLPVLRTIAQTLLFPGRHAIRIVGLNRWHGPHILLVLHRVTLVWEEFHAHFR